MKMLFLGAGSAFTTADDNFQSNILLRGREENLLLDCGGDIRWSLKRQGLGIADVNSVYISHCHADHIGGMEWLGFATYFNPNLTRPGLYASADVTVELWENSLKGGMESIEGKIATLDDYFRTVRLPKNGKFSFDECEFKLVQVVHIMDGFCIMPSYGLFFETNGVKVFWTSDTQFAPAQINHIYSMADVIFHDCETMMTANGPCKSGVHAHYSDLRTLDPAIKSKMWLYHYQPGTLPDAVADGFRGFVRCGQEFDFARPETL